MFLGVATALLTFTACRPQTGLQISTQVNVPGDANPKVLAVDIETGDTASCFVNNPKWGDHFPEGRKWKIFVSADNCVTKTYTLDTTGMADSLEYYEIEVTLLPTAYVYSDSESNLLPTAFVYSDTLDVGGINADGPFFTQDSSLVVIKTPKEI